MGYSFGSCEIVNIGIEIEKNGRDFYRALASQTSSVPLAELFDFLSKEEEKHIGSFAQVREALKICDDERTADEYYAYMSALAGASVFSREGEGSRIAREVNNDDAAIALAIKFELDSIVFFEGMKGSLPQQAREVVDILIAQEKSHVIRLNELKKR